MRIPFPCRPRARSHRAVPVLVALFLAGLVPAASSPAIASDGAWVTVNRLARYDHSAIVDVENDRMVVFGGIARRLLNDVWTLSLHGTPTWSPLAVRGTPPSPRFYSAVTYDPVRKRMLVFGGRAGSFTFVDDVWELTLDSTPTWTQLFPTGTAPSLYQPAMIFDPVRDRMLVFGSTRADVGLGATGTWELSLGEAPAWTQLDAAGIGPQPSYLRSPVVYDPGEDRIIVITGSPGVAVAIAWSLSLGGAPTWTLLDPSGTPPSAYAVRSAVLDAERRQIVVPPYWTLTLDDDPTWTDLRTPSPVEASVPPDDGARLPDTGSASASTPVDPLFLTGYVAGFDGRRDRVVLCGGAVSWPWGPMGDPLDDAWAINLDPAPGTPIWEELSPAGVSPSARGFSSAVRDRDRLILFGGARWAEPSNEAWTLPLEGPAVWSKLEPAGDPPAPRRRHAAIVDPVRRRMIVFGGLTGTGPEGSPLDDTWALSLQGRGTWTQLFPAGAPPDAGGGYMSIYDPEGDRMLVTSGARTWALDLDTPAWSELAPAGPLPPWRWGGTAVYDSRRDRLLLPSGATYNGQVDLWALSLRGDPTWTNLGPGLTRTSAVAIYDPARDRIVVHGGWDDYCICPAIPGDCDCSYYDTWARGLEEGAAWVQLFPADSSAWIRGDQMAGICDPAGDRLIATSGSMTLALEFPPSQIVHSAVVEIVPRVINPASHGQWITARVEPADVTPADVDVSTALLAGSVPADPTFAEIGDHDGNGAADLLLKFPRAAVEQVVVPGINELELTAALKTGGGIRGTGTVNVIGPPGGFARGTNDAPVLGAIEPNPFGPSTSIRYDVPGVTTVRIAVHDVGGRLVSTLLDGPSPPGRHTVTWNGRDGSGEPVASGIYFVIMDSGNRRVTRKVTLLR